MSPITPSKLDTVIILITYYCYFPYFIFFLIEERREENSSNYSAWVSAITQIQEVWLQVSHFSPGHHLDSLKLTIHSEISKNRKLFPV